MQVGRGAIGIFETGGVAASNLMMSPVILTPRWTRRAITPSMGS